jgi:hypothetical protein
VTWDYYGPDARSYAWWYYRSPLASYFPWATEPLGILLGNPPAATESVQP